MASGHLKDPNAGFGAALTSAIRGFQADMGLKPDGLIEPGGETEELLADRSGSEDKPQIAQVKSAQPAKQPPASTALQTGGSVGKPTAADKLFQDFRKSLAPREGGFTNHPDDRGGPTNKGMSQRTLNRLQQHPKWKRLPSRSKNLTDKQIDEIFRDEFFDRPQIGKLAQISRLDRAAPKLAEQVFDAGVQHGPKNSGKFLQQALDDILDTDLRVAASGGAKQYDGIIGSRTRAAISDATRRGLIKDVNNLMVRKRIVSMRNDVVKHPK